MSTKRKTKRAIQRDTDEVITSIRIPRETHERFRAYAVSRQRTVSGELRLLIDQSLEQERAA